MDEFTNNNQVNKSAEQARIDIEEARRIEAIKNGSQQIPQQTIQNRQLATAQNNPFSNLSYPFSSQTIPQQVQQQTINPNLQSNVLPDINFSDLGSDDFLSILDGILTGEDYNIGKLPTYTSPTSGTNAVPSSADLQKYLQQLEGLNKLRNEANNPLRIDYQNVLENIAQMTGSENAIVQQVGEAIAQKHDQYKTLNEQTNRALIESVTNRNQQISDLANRYANTDRTISPQVLAAVDLAMRPNLEAATNLADTRQQLLGDVVKQTEQARGLIQDQIKGEQIRLQGIENQINMNNQDFQVLSDIISKYPGLVQQELENDITLRNQQIQENQLSNEIARQGYEDTLTDIQAKQQIQENALSLAGAQRELQGINSVSDINSLIANNPFQNSVLNYGAVGTDNTQQAYRTVSAQGMTDLANSGLVSGDDKKAVEVVAEKLRQGDTLLTLQGTEEGNKLNEVLEKLDIGKLNNYLTPLTVAVLTQDVERLIQEAQTKYNKDPEALQQALNAINTWKEEMITRMQSSAEGAELEALKNEMGAIDKDIPNLRKDRLIAQQRVSILESLKGRLEKAIKDGKDFDETAAEFKIKYNSGDSSIPFRDGKAKYEGENNMDSLIKEIEAYKEEVNRLDGEIKDKEETLRKVT